MDSKFTTTVPVRFRDRDAVGHVNNAVYATYLEQARIEYLGEVVDADVAGAGGFALVHLQIDYERSVGPDVDAVAVSVRVTDLGESSVRMVYEIRAGTPVEDAEAPVVATAESVTVRTAPDGDGTRPLPEAWREAVVTFEGE
jgi:acyl-CoA thioester hydrolase